MTFPQTHDLTLGVNGAGLNEFIKSAIEDNTGVFEVDPKEMLVSKKYVDGITEPTDMATYALYHVERLRKTNSVEDDVKIKFTDLTPEEIATSFIQTCDPKARE